MFEVDSCGQKWLTCPAGYREFSSTRAKVIATRWLQIYDTARVFPTALPDMSPLVLHEWQRKTLMAAVWVREKVKQILHQRTVDAVDAGKAPDPSAEPDVYQDHEGTWRYKAP